MNEKEQTLIQFLKEQILGEPDAEIGVDTALLSSGLVDSFSLIEILQELERVTGAKIPAGRAAPEAFETVRDMLTLAKRWS